MSDVFVLECDASASGVGAVLSVLLYMFHLHTLGSVSVYTVKLSLFCNYYLFLCLNPVSPLSFFLFVKDILSSAIFFVLVVLLMCVSYL